VVEEVVEATVGAEVHIQNYRAPEVEKEPHKDPCCLDCLQQNEDADLEHSAKNHKESLDSPYLNKILNLLHMRQNYILLNYLARLDQLPHAMRLGPANLERQDSVDVAEVVEMMAVGVELGVYHQVAEEQN
jgi:hypothetical protein